MLDTSNTDDYEMSLKAAWDRNNSRNSLKVYRCSYVGMSMMRCSMTNNSFNHLK